MFIVDQILGVKNGLVKDLAAVGRLRDEAITACRDFFNQKARAQFTDGYRQEQLKTQLSAIAQKAADIYGPAMQNAQAVLDQAPLWSVESMIRRARLTNAPKPISTVDKVILLDSEMSLLKGINGQAEAIGELLENSARLRYLTELELLPNRDFAAVLEEAATEGNAGLIYLASLVQPRRKHASEQERNNERDIVMRAKASLDLPDRELAADTIEQIRALKSQIQMQWETLQFNRTDLRDWAANLLERAEFQSRIQEVKR